MVGTIMLCTGVLSTVGMALVTEGAADMFYAERIFMTRDFDWTAYTT
jgi:hypothetical protein